jgi:flavin reductase (DIM6/NTAB) family NADH-FMN oxidoreductase RutF
MTTTLPGGGERGAPIVGDSTAGGPTLADGLRRAMRGVAATVTIVTTTDAGARFGMTASSFTSVSLDPPSVLVAVHRDASLHGPLLRSRRFAVNVLATGGAPLARLFADSRLEAAERFRHGHWRDGPEGLPLLEEAQTRLVCRLTHAIEVGTHTLAVGMVEAVEAGVEAAPLVYAEGEFHHFIGAGV